MALQNAPKPVLKVIATLVIGLASVGLSLFLPVVASPDLSQTAFADINTGIPMLPLFDRVNRNTVVGESVPVCADLHPNATQQAANMWNSGLRGKGFVEFDVFTFVDTCPFVLTESEVDIDHITVRSVSSASYAWGCGPNDGGCALVNRARGPNNSFVGVIEIHIGTENFPVVHEDATSPGYTLDGFKFNRAGVAHELGHTFALPHPKETTVSDCFDALMLCAQSLQARDYEDFGRIYRPNRVAQIGAAPYAEPFAEEVYGETGVVEFHFDPRTVKVAKSIVIRQWDAANRTWGPVVRAFRGTDLGTRVTTRVERQPAGPKTYGIFSTTRAYLNTMDPDVTKRQEYVPGAGWIGFVRWVPTIGCRLTTTAGTGGAISPTSGTQPCAESVVVTATPDTGYQVDEWSGSGAANCVDGDVTCTVAMGDSDRSVDVSFERKAYTLTITAGPSGVVNPVAGTHTHLHGDRVLVTANPDSGYRVAGWTGDCSGRSTSCTLTMDMPRTAGVTFEVRPPPPPPPVTIINLVAGLNEGIAWPGERVLIETAVQGLPVAALFRWIEAEQTYYTHIVGAPDFVNRNLQYLDTGFIYIIRASEAFAWRVTDAAASARDTSERASAPLVSASGWTATVTCDSGFGPILLPAAATEAEAASAASWLIAHAQGCGGAGAYTLSFGP